MQFEYFASIELNCRADLLSFILPELCKHASNQSPMTKNNDAEFNKGAQNPISESLDHFALYRKNLTEKSSKASRVELACNARHSATY